MRERSGTKTSAAAISTIFWSCSSLLLAPNRDMADASTSGADVALVDMLVNDWVGKIPYFSRSVSW